MIRKLYPAEVITLLITCALLSFKVAATLGDNVSIAWGHFAFLYGIAAVLGFAGLFYRWSGRNDGIALSLLATALLIGFTNAGASFNHLLMPITRPAIDGALFDMDAAIGFEWLSFVEAMKDYPVANRLLAWVYNSSLLQLIVIVVLLGFTRRQVELHRFLLVGTFSSCITILIWTLVPSFGPAAYVQLDAATETALSRVVNASYGAELLALAQNGPAVISPDRLMGLIAFPSMHTVMAGMAVWFTYGTRAFLPLTALNLAMLPAIILHGGHHLVDLIGGAVVFVITTYAACLLVRTNQEVVRNMSSGTLGFDPALIHVADGHAESNASPTLTLQSAEH